MSRTYQVTGGQAPSGHTEQHVREAQRAGMGAPQGGRVADGAGGPHAVMRDPGCPPPQVGRTRDGPDTESHPTRCWEGHGGGNSENTRDGRLGGRGCASPM